MVRSAGYGAGALLGAVLLAWDPAMLPWLLAVKLVTSTMAAIFVFTMRMPCYSHWGLRGRSYCFRGYVARCRPVSSLSLPTRLKPEPHPSASDE